MAERCGRNAGNFAPDDEGIPHFFFVVYVSVPHSLLGYPTEKAENVFDELDDTEDVNTLLKGFSPSDYGWLAKLITDRCSGMEQRIGEEIASELNVSLPSQSGISLKFDPCIHLGDLSSSPSPKLPSSSGEGRSPWDTRFPAQCSGYCLGCGVSWRGYVPRRKKVFGAYSTNCVNSQNTNTAELFQVSNLLPSRQGAWRHHNLEDEVSFNTRRDTKWKPLPPLHTNDV